MTQFNTYSNHASKELRAAIFSTTDYNSNRLLDLRHGFAFIKYKLEQARINYFYCCTICVLGLVFGFFSASNAFIIKQAFDEDVAATATLSAIRQDGYTNRQLEKSAVMSLKTVNDIMVKTKSTLHAHPKVLASLQNGKRTQGLAINERKIVKKVTSDMARAKFYIEQVQSVLESNQKLGFSNKSTSLLESTKTAYADLVLHILKNNS